MKLLYCEKCQDIFRIYLDKFRLCKCGGCGGRYIGNKQAEYFGDTVIPLGFDNFTFGMSLKLQPYKGRGKNFNAFSIPKECKTFIKIEKPK